MKSPKLNLSAEELEWLQKNSTKPMRDYHAGFCNEFGRDGLTTKQLKAVRRHHGWPAGLKGYQKGHTPWAKGRKLPHHPDWRGRHFKKGDPSPRARVLGSERTTKDGCIELLIDKPNPRTGYKYRWVRKHRYLWEKQHGPVPEGMALMCKDGDRSNCDISNWELINSSMIPSLCMKRGYTTAPAELKPTIMAVTKLEYSLRQKVKGS